MWEGGVSDDMRLHPAGCGAMHSVTCRREAIPEGGHKVRIFIWTFNCIKYYIERERERRERRERGREREKRERERETLRAG